MRFIRRLGWGSRAGRRPAVSPDTPPLRAQGKRGPQQIQENTFNPGRGPWSGVPERLASALSSYPPWDMLPSASPGPAAAEVDGP